MLPLNPQLSLSQGAAGTTPARQECTHAHLRCHWPFGKSVLNKMVLTAYTICTVIRCAAWRLRVKTPECPNAQCITGTGMHTLCYWPLEMFYSKKKGY